MSSTPQTVTLERKPSRFAHVMRQPLVALIAEFLILAIPLNFVYGFAIHNVYRVGMTTGLLFALVAAAVACNGYALYARYVVGRTADELAWRRMSDLFPGAALGAALIVTVVAIIALGGDLHLSAGGWPALAGLPGVVVLAGAFEELIARGVLFRNLENIFGSEIAIALSATWFGWMHIGSPHATILSAAAIGLEGGVLLAAVYMATRSLWWPIGLHMAWNFTETGVFGIADSGIPGRGLLHAQFAGPEWLTGGVFGIEASVVAVIVCLAAAIVFLLRAYRSGQVVAPLWERRHR